MRPFRHELDRVSARPVHPSTLELPLDDRLYKHGACEGSTGLGLAVGVPFSRTPVTLSGIFGTNLKAVWPFYGANLVTHQYSSSAEKVTDGGFDNAPDWTDSGSGHWAVAGSKATATTAAAGEYLKAAVDPLVVGVLYQVTYTIDAISAGSITVKLGTTAGTARSAPGTYVENIRCAGSGQFAFYGSAGPTTGSITVCSVVGVSEQLYNGDFETGSPPTGWTGASATVSAQAGARTGGSGSQLMRATVAVATAAGSAFQVALVSGATYRARGWARGDGTNGQPRINGGADFWSGTTSTDWQYFDVTFRATSANFACKTSGDVATEDYTEWDDVSVYELPTVVTAPNSLNPGTYDATQATKAKQGALHPTDWNGYECAKFLGDSYYTADGFAALVTGEDKPWFALTVVTRTSTAKAGLVCLDNSANNTPRNEFYYPGAATAGYFHQDDAAATTGAGPVAVDTAAHVLGLLRESVQTSLFVDGVLGAGPTATNIGATTVDQCTIGCIRRIATSDYLSGNMRLACAGTTAIANQMITASNLLDATEHV